MRDSDATVIFTLGPTLSGGSLRTQQFANRHGKPCLHLPLQGGGYDEPALLLQRFVEANGVKILNLAGSRESSSPGIGRLVAKVIEDGLFWSESHPNTLGGPGEG